MNQSFGRKIETATSSATEAGFCVLKHNVFAGVGRIRVDAWLERHLKYLLGKSLNENIDFTGEDFDEGHNECEDDLIIECNSDDCENENENEFEQKNKIETNIEKQIETNIEKQTAFEGSVKADVDKALGEIVAKKILDKCVSRHDDPKYTTQRTKVKTKKAHPFDGNVKHESWMGQTDEAKKPMQKFPGRSRQSILNAVETAKDYRYYRMDPSLKWGMVDSSSRKRVRMMQLCKCLLHFTLTVRNVEILSIIRKTNFHRLSKLR